MNKSKNEQSENEYLWLEKYTFHEKFENNKINEIRNIIEKHASIYPVNIKKIIEECDELAAPICEDLGEDVSGKIEKSDDDKYTITVNNRHSENRRRFTLAHEFAHYILHKGLIGNGIVDDALYRSERPLGSNDAKVEASRYPEVEANRLAADILMPMHHIYELIKKDPSIVAVARELKVSTLALRVRLGILYDDYMDSIENLLKKTY